VSGNDFCWEEYTAMRPYEASAMMAEARALLAPIYGWFPEGFDTPDLQEAKTFGGFFP
jgi:predicted ATPase